MIATSCFSLTCNHSGFWTTALKTLPLASQETCAAMEFYHNQLKLRLLNEKDSGVYQRADWLVDKLGTKVHSYFWLDEYSGKDDFTRYWKDEWLSGLTSWRKSLKIPDSDVVMEGKYAKVTDLEDRARTHIVWNPGSEFGICNCEWAEMGNLCEHVFKLIKVSRDKGSTLPSICMLQYSQALINMLHCPPHDSLIRDHAVSLAIWVQMQLNAQIDTKCSHVDLDPVEHCNVGPVVSASQDGDVVNGSHCADENISQTENGSGHDSQGGNTIDQLASKDDCSEKAGVDICGEMDVDPSSICTSTSGLLSVDGVTSSDIFTSNGERSLINTGPNITENLPSSDHSLTNLNDFDIDNLVKDHQENVMDVELQSKYIASLTAPEEQCTTIHQNRICSNAPEPVTVSLEENVNPNTNITCLSVSMAVDSEPFNMVEASSIIKEIQGMDLQNDEGITIQNLSTADNVAPSEGNQGNIAEDTNPDYDASRNGGLTAECPESVQNSKSVSGDKPPPVDLVAHQTETSVKLSPADKPSIYGCGAQDGVAD